MSPGTKVYPHFELEAAPVDDSHQVRVAYKGDMVKEDHNSYKPHILIHVYKGASRKLCFEMVSFKVQKKIMHRDCKMWGGKKINQEGFYKMSSVFYISTNQKQDIG